MVMDGGKAEGYNLDPKFERVVVTLACTSASFFKRVGGDLRPDGFADEVCELAIRAALSVAKETGRGPQSSVVVLQRLRRWMGEGRVTLEQIRGVGAMFDEVEDAGLPEEDTVVAELAPVLRHLYEKEAARAAVETYSKRGDWDQVVNLVDRARNVGITDRSPGVSLGAAAFDEIVKMQNLNYLPTGILELDAFLDGGLCRGKLGMVIAEPGGGKSMFLDQVTAHAVYLGQNVCVATLELPESEHLARLTASLTCLPTKAVQNGQMGEARRRMLELDARLGKCVVKYFTPGVTAAEDIVRWKCETEQRIGQTVALLTVDYADKLTVPARSKYENEYKVMDRVYETLRIHAERTETWCWTASQSKRGDGRRKRIGLDDVADSMGKVRVADLVVTLNVTEQQEQVSFFVAKNRTGQAVRVIGPLPTDFALGRIAAVSRQEPTF